jgi:hypothetical protein
LLVFNLFDKFQFQMSETHAEEPPTQVSDEAKRLEFEVVRPTYKPRGNPRGQARRLTLRVFIRVCHLVEQGWAITKACDALSITYSLFRLRCSENPRLQERIKEAEAIRFQRRHEEAVESVMRAGEKSWMAHAWYLERVLPNLYALKNVNRSEAATDQAIGDKIDESQLRRYAALIAEFERENEAKAVEQTVSLPAPESAAG